MAKGPLAQPSDVERSEPPLRPKRGKAIDTNSAFLRAFADALRDILYDERRRTA